MNMNKAIPFAAVILAVLFSGCEINQKEVLPEDGFLKIYNHPDEALSFYPESVVELDGGGYLLISAVKDEASEIEYPSTHLVAVSSSGEVAWSQFHDWLAPSARMFRQGNRVGFVAMNQQFDAYALLVDPSSGNIAEQHDLGITMPLAAHADERGDVVVLGYDFVTRSSWIARYNSSFTLQRSNKLPINTDLEYLVQRHLNKTGQDFPFYIGEYSTPSGTGYFVNCFYNYTLRAVFLDISSLGTTGDIYSFQIEEAISSLIHKSGSVFGLTSYYEGNNYILPGVEIDVSTSRNIKDIPADPLYELTYRAGVQTTGLTNDAGEYALFTSQTNSSSIVLYQYEMDSDSLVHTIYRTFDESVTVRDIIPTRDGGIAILAGIPILGKYERPLLLKLPEEEFLPEEK